MVNREEKPTKAVTMRVLDWDKGRTRPPPPKKNQKEKPAVPIICTEANPIHTVVQASW